MSASMFDYACEYCNETVKPQRVDREAFKHKNGFVILEDITIGVYDTCGNRYYSSETLRHVHALATGARTPKRTESVFVG